MLPPWRMLFHMELTIYAFVGMIMLIGTSKRTRSCKSTARSTPSEAA
jgi:hypothetical protein